MQTIKPKKGGEASPSPPNGADNRENGIHSAAQRYPYIPVDYIRGKITGINPDTLLEKLHEMHPANEIQTTFTGEGVHRESFSFQNMVFNRYAGSRVYISGSLHKFWNNGEHNWNQFTDTAFDEVIAKLRAELLIGPENINITRLEYGVNITPPMPCADILNRCYLQKGVEILQMHTKGEGKYHCAVHGRYTFKIYDKGKQYNLPQPTLRIENKVTNWSQLRFQGIVTLSDFIDVDKTQFVDDLITRWNEIIFADPTTVYPEKWHKFTNREYWRELRAGCRQKFRRRFNMLKYLNQTQGKDIQGQIGHLIWETIQGLQKVNQKEGVTFDNFRKKRLCRLTGLSIACQKKNSFLLSHTGLKSLITYDMETFRNIKKAYLSDKWQNAPRQVQVKEIAHNIRNHYFNRNRPTPGARNPAQAKLTLFVE